MQKQGLIAVLTVALAGLATAQTFGPTGTSTLQVSVAAEAVIRVDTATTALTAAQPFQDFAGTTNLTYKIRTKQTGGTGTITVQVTSDFSPANGPSVSAPPTAGDALTYTCTVAAPGTGCTGTQTASRTAATAVATFGANAHSTKAGNAGSLAWILTNDPAYQTGDYSATVTFTISAT